MFTSSQLRSTASVEYTPSQTSQFEVQIGSVWNIPSGAQLLRNVVKNMTDEEVKRIASLTYVGTNRPVLDTSDFESVVEIINLCADPNYSAELRYSILKFISENPNKDLVWSMPSTQETISKYEYEYKLSVERPTGTAFHGKCANKGCPSKVFNSIAVQTRSADEPAKQIVICMRCFTSFNA